MKIVGGKALIIGRLIALVVWLESLVVDLIALVVRHLLLFILVNPSTRLCGKPDNHI